MSQSVNEPAEAPERAVSITPGIEQIRQDIADVLYEPAAALGDDDDLLDRGLDSIRLMSLVERWRQIGADISFVELAEHPSVRGLHDLLGRKLAHR
ncbi:phosphopantetheine-binding protein [Frankia sp. AgPm24]|uniref:phosphopantetheine-binding protein n=1 Tax=Frankia sp. AgPm24 TaxID=631128 RepID=UPI00200F9632|nr:phosphopantetheine-binding protein [Frankia sp. AgPm24]MCK9920714.1 phosphopantetheine-binding protein [Frankia sp. AgPm24]